MPESGLDGEDLISPVLEHEEDAPRRAGPGIEVGFLMLILGLAIGAVLSTFGLELFAENATAIFTAMLTFVLILVIIFVALVVLRRSIWARLFSRTEIEIDRLAAPLSDVARHAAEKDVPKATHAARSLAELVLARYAWLATRRWLIASITGMIAAIAALAGSALLFQQNELLKEQGLNLVTQTQLLSEQNERIDIQIGLLQTDAQLKDSDRSANILPDIVAASSRLGDEIQSLQLAGKTGPNNSFALEDISLSLRNQFITITNTVRPYRYLKSDIANQYTNREMRDFAMRRRTDLPKTLETMGVSSVPQKFELIDRPLSPERGAIINALFNFRILETELLSFFGADFSYAEISTPNLFQMTFRHANLRFADFRNMEIRSVRFGAAGLENARFVDSYLTDVSFSGHTANAAPEPFLTPGDTTYLATQTSGIEFTNSMLYRNNFSRVEGFAQNFDNSLIVETNFSNADLAGATFRNAVLLDVNFTNAFVPSVDFDGAIVFEANFLDRLADEARPGSFVRERFELEPIEPTSLRDIDLLIQFGIRITSTSINDKQAFRIKRVKPFEQ